MQDQPNVESAYRGLLKRKNVLTKKNTTWMTLEDIMLM